MTSVRLLSHTPALLVLQTFVGSLSFLPPRVFSKSFREWLVFLPHWAVLWCTHIKDCLYAAYGVMKSTLDILSLVIHQILFLKKKKITKWFLSWICICKSIVASLSFYHRVKTVHRVTFISCILRKRVPNTWLILNSLLVPVISQRSAVCMIKSLSGIVQMIIPTDRFSYLHV